MRASSFCFDKDKRIVYDMSSFILHYCRFSHALGLISTKLAHEKAVKSVAMLQEGPRLLTGSVDATLKVLPVNASYL